MATRYWAGLLLMSVLQQTQGTAARAGDCFRQRYIAPYVAPVKAVVAYPVLHQIGYGIRENALAELAADKAVEKVTAKFEAKIAAMQQQFNAGLSGRVCLDFNTAGAAGAAAGGTAQGAATPAPGDHTAAQAVFTESCVSCHAGPTAKGGLDLSDLSKLPAAKLQKAALRAYTGSMPPQPGQPIAQEKADQLLKWAEALKVN